MPRPKLKNASPTFSAHAHPLSKETEAKLIQLLGYLPSDITNNDKLNLALLDVQTWLGAFPEIEKNVDGAPRPRDYVATFKPIQREAERLFSKLTGFNGYLSDQLKTHGADVDEIKKALATLRDTSHRIVADFAQRSSKGAKRNTALTQTIRELRTIFRNTYQGLREQRHKRGAFQWRAEQEKRELEFIYIALRDARIIPKTYKRELPRLFKDARCALPEERAQVMERLAHKAQRERKQ